MRLALIGNPNCGKSTLFNLLTGSRQQVGNWPGVTVERKTGFFQIDGKIITLIDLPGTYSIEHDDASMSQDEMIARDFVMNESDSLIVNIIDATNLQRSLYLTLQLLDLNRPLIVVLNMIDALGEMNEILNLQALTMLLGCPVVAISASKKKGVEQLQKVFLDNLLVPIYPTPEADTLHADTKGIIDKHLSSLNVTNPLLTIDRFTLLSYISGAKQLTSDDKAVIEACREELAQHCDNEIDIALACSRYDAIETIMGHVLEKPREASQTLTDKLDRFALGRLTGIPLFFLSMYAMFSVAINFGSVFIDFFETFFDTLCVEGVRYLLITLNAPNWMIILLANGIGSGIKTVMSFVPVIAAMFFCLSVLEDSGYLARAAMVVDRGMRLIGLPGKAFIPMLVGFGCSVPAIMGTRTLESARDRLISICMIPFMSCGARLPVYALFAMVFFPQQGASIVYILYLLGLLAAIFTGLILKSTLLPGTITPFIMELPVYRIPTVCSIMHLTWIRLKSFICRAGVAIIAMVTVLGVLNTVSLQQGGGKDSDKQSILAVMSQKITPIFSPMGITPENWPATVGLFTGIFAKEAVIGTLNSLYSIEEDEVTDSSFDFMAGVTQAFASIPHNIVEFVKPIASLIQSPSGNGITTEEDELPFSASAVTKIELAFGSQPAAMAYLIFVLLYTPCVAALGAIYREAGLRWVVFVGGWTFFVAWLSASAYYQYTLINQSPLALTWLVGFVVALISALIALKLMGKWGFMGQLTVSKSTNCGKGSCEPYQ